MGRGATPKSDPVHTSNATTRSDSDVEAREDNSLNESLIQPEWIALERKLALRKPKRKGTQLRTVSAPLLS